MHPASMGYKRVKLSNILFSTGLPTFKVSPLPLLCSMANLHLPRTAKMGHAKQKCSAVHDCILAGQKCITREDSYICCLIKREGFDAKL